LHPAEEVYIARCLTHRVLPHLKRLKTFRRTLFGQSIKLTNVVDKGRTEMYSADLSKATDYATHEASQMFWEGLCEVINQPDWVREAGTKILGPKQMPGGTNTTRGIHMGLGLSWPVLCLFNDWAAWSAGAPEGSYAVCGDDLSGLWSQDTMDRYEERLKLIGLVSNADKSFRGPRGVYCEQMVRIARSGTYAYSTPQLTMAEATTGKLRGNFTKQALAVLNGLGEAVSSGRVTHRDPLLATLTATSREMGKGRLNGCVRAGGSGAIGKKTDPKIAMTAFLFGAAQVHLKGATDALRGFSTSLDAVSTPEYRVGRVDTETLRIQFRSHLALNDQLTGKKQELRTISQKAFTTRSSRRVKKVTRGTHDSIGNRKQVLDRLKTGPWSAKTKRRLRALLWKGPKNMFYIPRRNANLFTRLALSRRVEYVSIADATRILKEHSVPNPIGQDSDSPLPHRWELPPAKPEG